MWAMYVLLCDCMQPLSSDTASLGVHDRHRLYTCIYISCEVVLLWNLFLSLIYRVKFICGMVG